MISVDQQKGGLNFVYRYEVLRDGKVEGATMTIRSAKAMARKLRSESSPLWSLWVRLLRFLFGFKDYTYASGLRVWNFDQGVYIRKMTTA